MTALVRTKVDKASVARIAKKFKNIPEEVTGAVAATLMRSGQRITAVQAAFARNTAIKQSLQWNVDRGDRQVKSKGVTVTRTSVMLTVWVDSSTMKQFGEIPALARWEEFGTSPHPIRRRKGGPVVGQHPGTAPAPYFWPGWFAEQRRTKAGIRSAARRGAKKAAAK